MRLDHVIPIALCCEMLAASIVCAACRRWLDCLYWAGGFVLNLSIILRG